MIKKLEVGRDRFIFSFLRGLLNDELTVIWIKLPVGKKKKHFATPRPYIL